MKYIFIIIAAVAMVGGLFYFFNKNKTRDGSRVNVNHSINQGNNNLNKLGSNGLYIDYSPELLAKADTGNVVLYFYASWCPTCKVLDKNLKAELSGFPEDLTVLKLNYDKESELKKKYEVVIQHTLVQVDSSGNEITKWIGGNDIDSVLSHLK